jgi:pantoate--beta-alanine ligase
MALIGTAVDEIELEPRARLEYVKLCDAETLEEIDFVERPAAMALAVRIGKARLIDNRVFSPV